MTRIRIATRNHMPTKGCRDEDDIAMFSSLQSVLVSSAPNPLHDDMIRMWKEN